MKVYCQVSDIPKIEAPDYKYFCYRFMNKISENKLQPGKTNKGVLQQIELVENNLQVFKNLR